MLKKIDWSDKFLTGHKEVDLQHQYFVELINRVIWNLNSAKTIHKKAKKGIIPKEL